MWLAETTVNCHTGSAHRRGVRFHYYKLLPSSIARAILNPGSFRYRNKSTESAVRSSHPSYRCFTPRRQSQTARVHRHLLLRYDTLSFRDMGFDDVLYNSYHLAGQIGLAVLGDHRPAPIDFRSFWRNLWSPKGGTEDLSLCVYSSAHGQ